MLIKVYPGNVEIITGIPERYWKKVLEKGTGKRYWKKVLEKTLKKVFKKKPEKVLKKIVLLLLLSRISI